jgi:hypothetical protein
MGRRLAREMEAEGIPPLRTGPVLDGCRRAVLARAAGVPDPEDPRFLHPGRTVLVLLRDGGERDPGCLAVAPLLDSVEPELQQALLTAAPPGARLLLQQVPMLPGGLGAPAERDGEGEWVEALVVAAEEVRRLVLAELLDQLRHLHVMPGAHHPPGHPAWGGEARKRLLHRVEEVFLPLSQRTGGEFERRLSWWWRRVGRVLRGWASEPRGGG